MLSAHDWQRPVPMYPWIFLIQAAHDRSTECPKTLRLAVDAPNEASARITLTEMLPAQDRAFCHRISREDFQTLPMYTITTDGKMICHDGFTHKKTKRR